MLVAFWVSCFHGEHDPPLCVLCSHPIQATHLQDSISLACFWLYTNCVISSCCRQGLHGQRYKVHQHGRGSKASSSGLQVWFRHVCLLPMCIWCISGHTLCSLQPAVLPGLWHYRYNWLHFRQCGCRFPELQHPAQATFTKPIQHHHSSGEKRP